MLLKKYLLPFATIAAFWGKHMPTIIFDFDSTLVSMETLDEILAANVSSEQAQQIADITAQGMNGELTFAESIQQRLKIARPSLPQINIFAAKAIAAITPGMLELISELQKKASVWIVSGGFRELLVQVAAEFHIPENQVRGISAHWNSEGEFISLDESNPFCESKIAGVHQLAKQWESPTICVGDGMTDYALFEANFVDNFIAYTEHQKRSFVSDLNLNAVDNVEQLAEAINQILWR